MNVSVQLQRYSQLSYKLMPSIPLYTGNGASTTENYGGAFVYKTNGVGGCILIDISAISNSSCAKCRNAYV